MTIEVSTEIKNILSGYDSDLIYILRRFKKLEEVARAAEYYIENIEHTEDSNVNYEQIKEALKELDQDD